MDKYYDIGKEKEYSFAIFFDKPKYLKDKVELGSAKVKMLFSTADKLTGFIFYSAFLENKNKKIPLEHGNEMRIDKIIEVKKQKITGQKALFQIASPICIRQHYQEMNQDFYYSHERKEFKEVFLHVVERQLANAGFSEKYIKGLDIEPIHCKKVIVKHYKCNIECTLGKIVLVGNQAVLQYLLDAGIGSRKSAGFGLLELVSNG